jgi:hypothetical protein
MVSVAQLVRAPGCGPGGHGFDPHLTPQKGFWLSLSHYLAFKYFIFPYHS